MSGYRGRTRSWHQYKKERANPPYPTCDGDGMIPDGLHGEDICSRCEGTGKEPVGGMGLPECEDWQNGYESCPVCHSSGRKQAGDFLMADAKVCPACKGTGKFDNEHLGGKFYDVDCPTCHGSGKVKA